MAENAAATRRFGCPSCGGGLQYDIPSHQMKCDRCGNLTAISSLPTEPAGDTLEVTEFHCPQCGAAVYSTDTEVTSFCSFCGSDVVLTGKLARTKRPARIVPFTVSREDCEKAYRDHLRSYLLAPSSLKAAETLSHFRPVYVPFWSYGLESSGAATLEGHKSYTKGDYRYDETYDLSMDAEIRQKGILYDASSAFEDETAAMLQHTAQQTEPFHPAYLSGFYAQGADVPAETYYPEVAATAVRRFMDEMKEKHGMDSVEMKGDISENFGLPHARYQQSLVMMPVWLLAHRQGARVVYTAVNGQSGEVVCDVPVSNGKVAGVVAALAAGLFVLLSLFATLRPELLMVLCAAICLITQYQFSGAQRLLFKRRTRASEPDFAGENQPFVGPAQSLLQVKDGHVIAKKGFVQGTLQKVLGYGIVAIVVIAWFMIGAGFRMLSAVGSSTSQRLIVLGGMALVTVVMIVHVIRRSRQEDRGPLWPRFLALAACAAGLIFSATGQVEDLIFYACAAAMLAASMVELVMINRSHNEYASRPVPFFDGKEESA